MRSLSKLIATAVLASSVAASAQMTTHHIYDDNANPKAQIASALAQAKREHKHVILDFGGDWCPDCQVLFYYLHKSPNQQVVEHSFVIVPISVGHIDKNLDIPAQYGIPIHKGVPALAVLDENGHLLYAQKNGEFESMRTMQESSVAEFLDRWKP